MPFPCAIGAAYDSLRIIRLDARTAGEVQSRGARRPNVYLLPDLYGWSSAGYTKWVEAANTFLGDRLIFGSAYPLMGTADIVEAYRRLPYKEGVLEKVLYHNAARLLGFKPN